MNCNEEQAKEIETIKDRIITLKLSDADCERIAKKVGKCGLTVANLLENFVGDLVSGTYSNGSDEREKAKEWFNRCWFGSFPEETLLQYLLDWNIDIEDFLIGCDEIEYYKVNPQEYAEEVKENGGETLWFEEEYYDYTHEFVDNHKDADMEKEIKLCREWFIELKKIKGIDDL